MGDNLITKTSNFFIKNFRTTLLLFFSILILGFLSYTTFLQREGFPEIEFPGALVNSTYFVEDSELVDSDITLPIVREIQTLDFVESVSSFSSNNISNISVSFNSNVESSEAVRILQTTIDSVSLPENSDVNIQTFDATSFAGENDIMLSAYSSNEEEDDLLGFVEKLSESIEGKKEVLKTNIFYPEEERVNPFTGEIEKVESNFARVGFQKNGEVFFASAINIGVERRDDSISTIQLSEAVGMAVNDIIKEENSDYDVVFVLDQAIELNRQIDSLENNALFGLLGVFFVLLIFINFRASIVAGIFIPTVLALTFLILYLSGNTLNIISLFSIILILGLFVDDAIVVVEAIDYQKKQGKKGLDAISNAINSIGAADVTGTITTIVVFAPMLFISGVLGDFVRQIPITAIIALTSSIVIALTIIPFFSKFFLSYKKPNPKRKFVVRCFTCLVPTAIDKLAELNSKFVKYYLQKPFLVAFVIFFSISVVILGGSYITELKFSIFPKPKDADNILINIENSEASNMDDVIDYSKEFESYLKDNFSESIDNMGTISGSLDSARYYIRLSEERDITGVDIESSINNWFDGKEDFEGLARIISAGPPEAQYQFNAQVFSEDATKSQKLAEDVAEFINTVELPEFLEIEEIVVGNEGIVNRDEGGRYIPIQVKINDPSYTGIISLLEDKIKKEFTEEKIQEYKLNADSLTFDQGLEGENIESFNDVIFAGIFSLIVIYIILVSQFKSFSLPFVILLAIPFAMAGLYPGLYYTDNALSFFVMLGQLGLIGIVINNTIIVIDATLQEKSKGFSPIDAISNAIKIRFRPLVATTFTTLVGLTPLALSDSFWEPLAFTIIFGLLSSTIISLLSIPAYYYIIEVLRTKIKSKIRFLIKN